MGTAAALKSALYIGHETNFKVCTCRLQVSLPDSIAPHSTTACLFRQSQADPVCSSSIILPLSTSQHLSICHRRSHLNLQLVVFALSSTSSSNRVSCGVLPWHPSFSESHLMDCCFDLQFPAVRRQPFQRKTSIPGSVRSSEFTVSN